MAFKNGSKRVVTLVNDWAPGIESETAFRARFMQAGGEIIEAIRIPLANAGDPNEPAPPAAIM